MGYPPRENAIRRLPDGREVVGTLTAAGMVGPMSSSHFTNEFARKHDLTRFASRSSRGRIMYWWLLDEVEAAREKVRASGIVRLGEEIVPMPFEDASEA